MEPFLILSALRFWYEPFSSKVCDTESRVFRELNILEPLTYIVLTYLTLIKLMPGDEGGFTTRTFSNIKLVYNRQFICICANAFVIYHIRINLKCNICIY